MTTHTLNGAGAPSVAPPSVGAHYTNTSNGDQYTAKGTGSVNDWELMAKKSDIPEGGDSQGGGLTKTNFIGKVINGALGVSNRVAYFDKDVGEFLALEPGLLVPRPIALDTPYQDAMLQAYPSEAGGSIVGSGSNLELHSGTTAENEIELILRGIRGQTVLFDAAGIQRQGFSIQDGNVESARISVSVMTNALSTAYGISVGLDLLGKRLTLLANRNESSTWMVASYPSSGDPQIVDTGKAITAFDFPNIAVELTRNGAAYTMVVKFGEDTVATFDAAQVGDAYDKGLGVSVVLAKFSGSTDWTTQVGVITGWVKLA